MVELRKALILLLILCFILPTLPVVKASEGSWTSRSPMPTSEDINTIGAAAVNGTIYFIGWNAYEKYDPEIDIWTPIAPLPIYNGWGTVVACQNKIYVIGGSTEVPTQVYDPATNTWENRTTIPSSRNTLEANVVDDKIYVIGGQHTGSGFMIVNPSSSNDVYDPETDSWSKMAPIPTRVMGYASVVLDDKIYIIGGGIANNEGGAPEFNSINLVQIFDPKTNQWTNGTPIPTGVAYAGACATSGVFAQKRIYVTGGATCYNSRSTSSSTIDLNQVYDPETGEWSTAASMPTPRYSSILVNVDDELYAVGGYYHGDVLATDKYTPSGYIPEFPSWIIFPLFLTGTFLAIVLRKRLSHRRP